LSAPHWRVAAVLVTCLAALAAPGCSSGLSTSSDSVGDGGLGQPCSDPSNGSQSGAGAGPCGSGLVCVSSVCRSASSGSGAGQSSGSDAAANDNDSGIGVSGSGSVDEDAGDPIDPVEDASEIDASDCIQTCMDGCCDSAGICQGSQDVTCGTGGASCVNCVPKSLKCVGGVCGGVVGPGGSSGSSGGACNAASCAACTLLRTPCCTLVGTCGCKSLLGCS
jgi:hypothetical protein